MSAIYPDLHQTSEPNQGCVESNACYFISAKFGYIKLITISCKIWIEKGDW